MFLFVQNLPKSSPGIHTLKSVWISGFSGFICLFSPNLDKPGRFTPHLRTKSR